MSDQVINREVWDFFLGNCVGAPQIPRQTESLFTENHEPFFNSIGQ